MFVTIEIPKEFEHHFLGDRFDDSLDRVLADITFGSMLLSGKYERETVQMLRKALKEAKIIGGQDEN